MQDIVDLLLLSFCGLLFRISWRKVSLVEVCRVGGGWSLE